MLGCTLKTNKNKNFNMLLIILLKEYLNTYEGLVGEYELWEYEGLVGEYDGLVGE